MVSKRNIFLIGPAGAGKSTVGRQLANQLRADFFDTDCEIEERAGVDIAWIFDVEGEMGLRKREENVINELTLKRGIVLATGGGAIVSDQSRNCLSAHGFVVYLRASIEKQLIRTQRGRQRPLLQVKDPLAVINKQAEERNPLYEEISDFIIATDGQQTKFVANTIIDKFLSL